MPNRPSVAKLASDLQSPSLVALEFPVGKHTQYQEQAEICAQKARIATDAAARALVAMPKLALNGFHFKWRLCRPDPKVELWRGERYACRSGARYLGVSAPPCLLAKSILLSFGQPFDKRFTLGSA